NALPKYHTTCSLGTWVADDTLVMIKKKYEIIDVSTDSVGRITCLKILYNNISIITISVYASAQK
ncbi:unnamed protein product, partial [Rotaria sordida]